jgi:hypothetical protein
VFYERIEIVTHVYRFCELNFMYSINLQSHWQTRTGDTSPVTFEIIFQTGIFRILDRKSGVVVGASASEDTKVLNTGT